MRVLLSLAGLVTAAAAVALAWTGIATAYFPLSTVDLDRGKALFEERCASCHSSDTGHSSGYGPDLSGIGAVAESRVPGLSAEEYLLQSIVDPAAYRDANEMGVMPADISSGLKRDEVISIVGYLMTNGSSPRWRHLVSLVEEVPVLPEAEPAHIDFAAVEAGKELFLGKGECGECHRLRALPGYDLRAPSLMQVGNHEEAYLRECILQPSKRVTAGYESWNVVLRSGLVQSGRLLRRDETSIDLLPSTPEDAGVVTIDLSDIQPDGEGKPMLMRRAQSPMPDGVPKVLSPSEIELIVQFLKTLK